MYKWEDKVKDSKERMFSSGCSECNECARIEGGNFNLVCYMRKFNLMIDYLRDESNWKEPLPEIGDSEERKVSLKFKRINFNFRRINFANS